MKEISKAHCFFEQSGTFKNEFIKLGIPAEDYDIQNDFGETDHVIDLFNEIEKAYDGKPSIFDGITQDDLIMAFFPCIHFCDANTMMFKGVHFNQRCWSLSELMKKNIEKEKERNRYFIYLMKLVANIDDRHLRCIIENPYSPNGQSFLQYSFINPSIIDKNRMMRGDMFVKPTGYWFIGCSPTSGFTFSLDKKQKIISKLSGNTNGLCSEERSMIHPDYARNFICDFILGKVQRHSQLSLEI